MRLYSEVNYTDFIIYLANCSLVCLSQVPAVVAYHTASLFHGLDEFCDRQQHFLVNYKYLEN